VADVLLLAVYSWGGVASMIALAGGLRDLGVSTRIAAYSDFGDKVRAAGCDFVDLEVSQADWWESQNAQQSDWAKNPLRTLKALRAGGKADARATAARLADIVKPGEGIVSGTLTVGTATGVAALRGSQVVAVHPAPMTPSHLAEGTLNPVTRRPSLANEWSGRLAARGGGWILRPAVNEGRHALGLPPWTARGYLGAVSQVPTVYGVSPAVMPADPAWPTSVTVAGHFLSPDPEPVVPDRLPDFLAAYPGAVYIGFGSWENAIKQSDLDAACLALALAGRPGVMADPDRRGPLPGTGTPVFAVGEVSHDWLFPRLAAVVHHGGSGTTHRAILAGVPNTAVPITFDQPYWGRRLAHLGVGAAPVPYRRLTPAALARAIRQMTATPAIAARAKELSAVLSAERGPAAAAGTIATALTRRPG
jgi:UDP:flavonoid glycosyltransferase YjiC (YdhE family)